MDFAEILLSHDQRPDKALADWLTNWSYLAIALKENKFNEGELLSLIKFELGGANRSHILDRLKSRWNTLRTKREKEELKKVRDRYAGKRCGEKTV